MSILIILIPACGIAAFIIFVASEIRLSNERGYVSWCGNGHFTIGIKDAECPTCGESFIKSNRPGWKRA